MNCEIEMKKKRRKENRVVEREWTGERKKKKFSDKSIVIRNSNVHFSTYFDTNFDN